MTAASTAAPSAVKARTSAAERYLPGSMIGTRYRMVGLLGRGGMGEVYRADDLKLGQPVALKFLPPDVEGDPDRLERFLSEVRMSLRVTHPNVCRVFDIGQAADRFFLSMEYVDGEDLASLLRRIGRLPEDKATEIARQLCAGLSAAHDEGVLHRDLKPANIMIDGRGRAKIADFGLAGGTKGIEGLEARVGTPQYMAPEQVAGGALSERTDIYALGLVLYEIFTGKRAFDADSLDQLHRVRSTTPTSPASHVSGLNPLVERAILRCLDPDPARRPASAAALAASLPGGDPLAMAIAAGDTPSPEMVAAAGSDALLRPAVAWPLLAAALVGSLVMVLVNQHVVVQRLAAPGKPPDVLVERAQGILSEPMKDVRAEDTAWGLELDPDYMNYRDLHRAVGTADEYEARAMRFWYRQSPVFLERVTFPFVIPPFVSPSDPAMLYSGEARVWLDRDGRLVEMTALPPQRTTAETAAAGEPDWSALFRAAGLDPGDWVEVPAQWTPQFFADRRAAWEPRPGVDTSARRVEAASFGQRPVSFQVVFPWTMPVRDIGTQRTEAVRWGNLGLVLVLFGSVIGSALVARRNLRLERADVRGATRLAAVTGPVVMAIWLIDEHHVASIWEMYLFSLGLARALFTMALLATMYLAVEPYVRRTWPSIIVSWSRIVAGDVRDPLVARDVLIGCAVGPVFVTPSFAAIWRRSHGGGLLRTSTDLRPFFGAAHALSELAWLAIYAVCASFLVLFVLFALRQVLRREWAAIVAGALLVGVPLGLAALPSSGSLFLFVSYFILYFFLLARAGLVAMIATNFAYFVLTTFPFTWPATTWYSGIGYVGVTVVAALAITAFRVATVGNTPARRTPA